MANIIDDSLKDSEVETTYYLFRPDTLLKNMGDLTFIYNPILDEWFKTKSIDKYIESGIPFKVLEEKQFQEIINNKTEDIIMKTEIQEEDIEELVSGKKHLNSENSQQKHSDLLPDAFTDKEIGGINILKFSKKISSFTILIIEFLIIAILSTVLILTLRPLFIKEKVKKENSTCEPFLKTITYKVNDKLNKDFSYYSSCKNKGFKSLDFKNVDMTKVGIYLYTGIDENGEEKTGTIIVK